MISENIQVIERNDGTIVVRDNKSKQSATLGNKDLENVFAGLKDLVDGGSLDAWDTDSEFDSDNFESDKHWTYNQIVEHVSTKQ